jgi:hypothetical protein
MIWPKGQAIHRIHPQIYGAIQFNPGSKGNARFSPIKNAKGLSIPTLYGGTTFDCAAMETIFHDVPFAKGLKTYDTRKLAGFVYSQAMPAGDLLLADLSNTALRKLGVTRRQLIDTEKDRYPQTRAWAEAFHARCPDIMGLCWVSRQDDRARALVLFGDRLPSGTLVPEAASRGITTDVGVFSSVVELADRVGLKLTGR